eukprot:360341-Chlamydomonas_euryale.AAC.9
MCLAGAVPPIRASCEASRDQTGCPKLLITRILRLSLVTDSLQLKGPPGSRSLWWHLRPGRIADSLPAARQPQHKRALPCRHPRPPPRSLTATVTLACPEAVHSTPSAAKPQPLQGATLARLSVAH